MNWNDEASTPCTHHFEQSHPSIHPSIKIKNQQKDWWYEILTRHARILRWPFFTGFTSNHINIINLQSAILHFCTPSLSLSHFFHFIVVKVSSPVTIRKKATKSTPSIFSCFSHLMTWITFTLPYNLRLLLLSLFHFPMFMLRYDDF